MFRLSIALFFYLLLGACVENDPQQSRWKQLITDPSVPPILERIGPGKAYLIRSGEIWVLEYSSETKYLPPSSKIDCSTDAFACDTLLPFMNKWGVIDICSDYHGSSVAITLYQNPKTYYKCEGVIYFKSLPEQQFDSSGSLLQLYEWSGTYPNPVRQENKSWYRFASFPGTPDFKFYWDNPLNNSLF